MYFKAKSNDGEGQGGSIRATGDSLVHGSAGSSLGAQPTRDAAVDLPDLCLRRKLLFHLRHPLPAEL